MSVISSTREARCDTRDDPADQAFAGHTGDPFFTPAALPA